MGRYITAAVCLTVLGVLAPDRADAGGWNTLEICNDGNTNVSVATVRNVLGFFSPGRELEAWFTIEPNSCKEVFAYDSAESSNAFITFLYRDVQNRDGVVVIDRPGDDRVFETSTRTFCVNLVNGFKTAVDIHDTCPPKYAPPQFQAVSFPIFFKATAFDSSEGASRQVLRLSPDRNRLSPGLIVTWGATTSRSDSVAISGTGRAAAVGAPPMFLGAGPLTFKAAERVEAASFVRPGWWSLTEPPSTRDTLRSTTKSAVVVVTYHVPATPEPLYYVPSSFVATVRPAAVFEVPLSGTPITATWTHGHSQTGVLQVTFVIPHDAGNLFSFTYDKGEPVTVRLPHR